MPSGYPMTQGFDSPAACGSPYTLPHFTNTDLHLSSNSVFPRVGEASDKFLPEELDIFEDPCYDPDPVSLIGPVSESLDNFQLDLGYVPDLGFQNVHHVKRMSDSCEVSRPSPIESPMSRFVPMENQSNKANEKGWQVWDSHGLAGPSSWLLPPEVSGLSKDRIMQSSPQKTMASLFKKDDQKTYSHYVHATDDDQWMPWGSYGSPNGSAINHPFQLSQGNFWTK